MELIARRLANETSQPLNTIRCIRVMLQEPAMVNVFSRKVYIPGANAGKDGCNLLDIRLCHVRSSVTTYSQDQLALPRVHQAPKLRAGVGRRSAKQTSYPTESYWRSTS